MDSNFQFLVARLSTVMGDGPAVPRSERICCGTEGLAGLARWASPRRRRRRGEDRAVMAAEAKAMLLKAVAAVKADRAKALGVPRPR